MSLRIATNTFSTNTQRYLANHNSNLVHSREKLASGSRINRAADDASGLAISERQKANLTSMQRATQNSHDGISLIQVAEGATHEISKILIRMKEICMQAATDTVGNTERTFLNEEFQGQKESIRKICSITEFNGVKLLDGSAPPIELQIGYRDLAGQDRLSFDPNILEISLEGMALADAQVDTKTSAQKYLEPLTDSIDFVSRVRSELGSLHTRLTNTIQNNSTYFVNLSQAKSQIRDVEFAEAVSDITRSNILSNTGISMLVHANSYTGKALNLLK